MFSRSVNRFDNATAKLKRIGNFNNSMAGFDSPYNSSTAQQQQFSLGESTTPSSAARSFVGFTRKLMTYVSGSPSTERLNAVNIDLEKNAGLASITNEYAQASPYGRSYGFGPQPQTSTSVQLPMFSSSVGSSGMNEIEAVCRTLFQLYSTL